MRPGVPPEPPPDDSQDLADRIKLTAHDKDQNLLTVYGPGLQAFQRLLQVLTGMQDTSGVTVNLDRTMQIGGLIIDATRAPFRVNGRKWSIAYDLAAPGANSNQVLLQNRPSQQPDQGLALATIEEIRYQGPSVLEVEVQYLSSISEISTDIPRDLEQPIVANDAAVVKFKNGVVGLGALQQQVAYAAANTRPAYLGNIAVGSPSEVWQPDGLVLWPGEILNLIQATALKSMTVTIVGKLWTFSRKST